MAVASLLTSRYKLNLEKSSSAWTVCPRETRIQRIISTSRVWSTLTLNYVSLVSVLNQFNSNMIKHDFQPIRERVECSLQYTVSNSIKQM